MKSTDHHKQNTVDTKKNTVEVLSSYSDHKRVRDHHPLDQYISFGSIHGPKGYKITALTSTFGGDLQFHGIGAGWRLLRVGDQDVSKMFTQKIKSNLDVQWTNSNGQGM